MNWNHWKLELFSSIRLKEEWKRERSKLDRVWFGLKKAFWNITPPVVQDDSERQQLFQELCWGTRPMTKYPSLPQVSRSCLTWHVPVNGCVHIFSYTAICTGEDTGIYRKCTVKYQSELSFSEKKPNLYLVGMHFACSPFFRISSLTRWLKNISQNRKYL